MFTGIVLGLGQILSTESTGGDTRLTIQARFPLPDIVVGESIAVNGACLTVEQGAANTFSAFASAETLRVTTLGRLRPGSPVNLERALAMGDRLGGHIVSGHVDAVVNVLSVEAVGESRRIRVAFPPDLAPEVIVKGSVTLEGVSLTINDCDDKSLCVNVIPETWRSTTIGHWQAGTPINFETDVLGKYVRRNLDLLHRDAPVAVSRIDLEFLRENGFA